MLLKNRKGLLTSPERKGTMLFNDTEKKVLTVWGCERRDLTIKRLAFAAAFAVDPKVKHAICLTRDDLILNWEDEPYQLVYLTIIHPRRMKTLDHKHYAI